MKKFLVVRFSSIGDIVLTSPVLRCLYDTGDVEIHYLTRDAFVPLLSANPYITRIYSIRKSITEVLSELKAEKYDRVIDLHRNIRTTSLLLRLLRPYARFRKLNLKKWLLVNFKWDLMPPIHIVDRYLETVSDLGVEYDGKGLDHFIPEDDIVDLSQWPQLTEKGFVCISAGSRHATKQLPAAHITDLVHLLNLPVVLLGGPEDRGKAQGILERCKDETVLDLTGTLNINQSASLISQSHALITGDTGLMHIAAALRIKVISVWGNTVPSFGMTPFFPDDLKHLARVIQVDDLGCRPCSKLGFPECPKGHFKCMMDIRPEYIANFLQE